MNSAEVALHVLSVLNTHNNAMRLACIHMYMSLYEDCVTSLIYTSRTLLVPSRQLDLRESSPSESDQVSNFVLTILARITDIYARTRPSATAYYIYVCSPRLTSSRVLAALAGKCLRVFL